MKKSTFIYAMKTVVLLCFMSTYFSFAQQTIIVKKDLNQRKSKNGFIRCATTENEEKMQAKNPNRMSNSQFENWIAPIIAKQKQANINNKTELNPLISQVFDLPDGDCYVFTINDSYGDGINTNGGLGSYSLKDENNTLFASGSTFQFNESKGFSFGSLSNSSFETSNEVYVYPNPTKESLNINLPTSMGLPNSYYITNSLGKIIRKKEVLKDIDLNVNTSSLNRGVYFIIIKKDNQKRALKFIKE